MIILLLIILLTAGCSYALYFTGLSLWFYFLWVPVSFIFAVLLYVLFYLLLLQILKKSAPTGKFRHWMLHQTCFMLLLFMNIRVKIIGKENVPHETFVCYANHKSDADPIILYYSLKRVCSAVGKKSLFKNFIIKQLQPVYGVISLDRENDRSAAKSIIEAIREVKNGLSMIIFPEGGIKTRDTEEMVNLRAGAYKLVTKSEALLLPVSIVGSSQTKKRKCFLIPAKVTVIIHKPYSYEEYQNHNTTEIGTMVMDLINKDVAEYEEKNLH